VTGAAAVGAVTGSPGRRVPDGIVITRWSLALSLSIALTLMAGAYSLAWQRMDAFHATQLTLVDRVSRIEVHTTFLGEEVAVLREEMHAGFAEVREEMRAGFAELREEMRTGFAELEELIRAGRTDGATGAD
jgi:hypothetical protein